MTKIPPHVQVTLCRALAVTAAVAAPLWFAAMAYSLLAGNRRATLWMAEAMGTPGGMLAALLLWLLFALPYGPLFFVLPLNGRFARKEKWLWCGGMILACCVVLGHAAFAAFWWTLAGRIERGEAVRPAD